MNVYRTTDLEGAARSLCLDYKLVVALQWLQNARKIALRDNLLDGVQVYSAKAKSKADPEIRAWHKTGGLFIRNYSGMPDYGHTEGLLQVEAPFTLEQWERDCRPCSATSVVYQPPSWQEHENTAAELYPPSEVAKRFWETLEIFKTRGNKDFYEAMLKCMELPSSGVVCVPKAEFYKRANMTARQMFRVSSTIMGLIDKQQGHHYCTAVILRFEPEKKEHRQLFKWIEANCPTYLNHHIIRGGEPGREFPEWKRTLRYMATGGFIQREDEVNFYMLSGMKPDFKGYDQRLKEGLKQLRVVIDFVEALPMLPLRSAPRSKAP